MICWRSFRCWYEDDEGLDDCVDDGTVEEDEEEEEEDDDEEDVDKGEAEEAGGGDESEDELSDDVDDEEVGEMDDDDAVDVDDSVFAANAVLKRVMAFRHAYSVASTWACLNLPIMSCRCLISVIILISFSLDVFSGVKPALASRGAISESGIWNCAADSIKISRHPSSNSASWSDMSRLTKAGILLAQRTHMNNNRAAVSQIDSGLFKKFRIS